VDDHTTASAALSASNCPAEKSRYEAQVRPMLDRMASMSVDTDACMNDMGHTGTADMQSTCRSMQAELDDHLAAACSTGDIAGEAARHASAMHTMLQHETDRAATMQSMMGDSSMMSGGMCHRG
jgi:hypothetical protein